MPIYRESAWQKVRENQFKWEDHVQLFDSEERVSEISKRAYCQNMEFYYLKYGKCYLVFLKVGMNTRELVIWKAKRSRAQLLESEKGT